MKNCGRVSKRTYFAFEDGNMNDVRKMLADQESKDQKLAYLHSRIHTLMARYSLTYLEAAALLQTSAVVWASEGGVP